MDSPLPSGEDGLAVPEALGDQRLRFTRLDQAAHQRVPDEDRTAAGRTTRATHIA
jgi:hypothetical protein